MIRSSSSDKVTLVVNLFGGPCTGKSVFASDLFSLLKKGGFDAELVQEFPKKLIREGKAEALKHQFYVFGNQDWDVKANVGRTEVVVTDSPVLLSPVYAAPGYPVEALEVCCKFAHDMDWSLNVFLERVQGRPFQQEGRIHDEEQSKAKDREIHGFLERLGVDHMHASADDAGLQKVMDAVSRMLRVRS